MLAGLVWRYVDMVVSRPRWRYCKMSLCVIPDQKTFKSPAVPLTYTGLIACTAAEKLISFPSPLTHSSAGPTRPFESHLSRADLMSSLPSSMPWSIGCLCQSERQMAHKVDVPRCVSSPGPLSQANPDRLLSPGLVSSTNRTLAQLLEGICISLGCLNDIVKVNGFTQLICRSGFG